MNQQATRASDFADSIGVNTHLGFGGPYGNVNQVVSDLRYLGVNNVRDAADYGTGPLTTLGQAGVKVDLLTSYGSDNTSQENALAPYLSSIEGYNEVNFSSRITPSVAQAGQQSIWNNIHSNPSLSGAKSVVYSVAVDNTAEYAPYGNNDAWTNIGNSHIYFGGGNQPAGPLAQYGYAINTLTPGQTEYLTETGYTSATIQQGGNQAVNEDVQAKYTLNLLMDAYKQGYGKSFLYELFNEATDGTQEGSYGLFRNDGTTAKPVGNAIHNVTSALADTGATANTFATGSLNYSITGLPSSGNSLLLQKSDGTYDLSVWAEPQTWNQNTMQESQSPVSNVTVNLGATFASVQVIDPMQGTAPVQTLSNVSSVNLGVTDHPLIVQIASGGNPTPPPPPPPAPTPTPTPVPASGVPHWDHVVVVVEENHSAAEINASAPYIKSLESQGATLTNYSAISHPSEPNYLAMYAGDTFGVTDDGDYSFNAPTLADSLTPAGKSFTGYVEAGSPRKHNPWESFPNDPNVEKDFASSFPQGNFQNLPAVSFVVPNQNNDMHDGTVQQGDAWLQQKLSSYADWAKANNSLLVVTTDEDDGSANNKVLTVLAGANVVPGSYNQATDHYGLLSTIAASEGVTAPGNGATAAPFSGMFGAAPPPPPPPPSPAPGTQSPDNTVILASQSGASIVDASNNVWTIQNGAVQQNGQSAGYSSSVKELAYEKGTIWQENSNNLWWSWNGSGWDGGAGISASPIPPPAPTPPPPPVPPPPPTPTPTPPPAPTSSPDNTVVLSGQSGASIVDSGNNTWTINGGVVQENGQNAGYTSSVKELAYEKGVVWQENSNNLWWSWNGSGWDGGAGISTSPVPAPTPKSGVDDTLVLDLSEDAYKGDAKAQILIDGKKFGSPLTITASHAAGQIQETDVSLASVAAGTHTIGIQFLNDLYAGTTSADRNMFVAPIKIGQMSGSTVINTTTYGSGVQGLYSTGDTAMFQGVVISH